MATKQELLAMTPRDCYRAAVRAGIETAVAENTLGQWFRSHPVFADQEVNTHTMLGSTEAQAEARESLKDHPKIGVVNKR